MSDDTLFPVEAASQPTAEPAEKLSADRRRTVRQVDALANGRHPLELALRWPLRLHIEAAPADDPDAGGRRCGNCRFRRRVLHNDGRFPKCLFGAPADGDAPRVTRGNGTDVRAWWPGCRDHEPGDPKLPDAMRWVPDTGAMR